MVLDGVPRLSKFLVSTSLFCCLSCEAGLSDRTNDGPTVDRANPHDS
jgi:hypothetical protein